MYTVTAYLFWVVVQKYRGMLRSCKHSECETSQTDKDTFHFSLEYVNSLKNVMEQRGNNATYTHTDHRAFHLLFQTFTTLDSWTKNTYTMCISTSIGWLVWKVCFICWLKTFKVYRAQPRGMQSLCLIGRFVYNIQNEHLINTNSIFIYRMFIIGQCLFIIYEYVY